MRSIRSMLKRFSKFILNLIITGLLFRFRFVRWVPLITLLWKNRQEIREAMADLPGVGKIAEKIPAN